VKKECHQQTSDVNATRTDNGATATPLCADAYKGNTEMVTLMAGNNADVNASLTNDGITPLYVTAQEGHTEVVKLLLDNNVYVIVHGLGGFPCA